MRNFSLLDGSFPIGGMPIATFEYKNWKGKIETRKAKVIRIEWQDEPGYEYKPGWFLIGICQDKGEQRDFAMSPDHMRPAGATFE